MKMSELRAKIKEMIIAEMDLDVTDETSGYDFLAELEEILEAEEKEEKDKKEDADIEAADDVAVGDEEITTDTEVAEVDPNVKAVQDALTQAQTAAQQLGDKKLINQIGNTITFFTRAHVVEKPGGAIN
jgi:maltooligosyltrehalose synthase